MPWQPEEADPSSECESCQRARLLVNNNPPKRGVALFIGQHAPDSTDRPKEKKKNRTKLLVVFVIKLVVVREIRPFTSFIPNW